jgi:hypothetical protein
LELDSLVNGRARCGAEVVGESVVRVCRCGFCGVSVSGGSTGAIASATDREPSEEGFEEEGERKGEIVSPCRVPRSISMEGVQP